MALKLPDSAVPMGDFPVAKAVDIDFNDGENLQEKLDNGKLGGGGNTTDLTDLENRVTTNEANITDLQELTSDLQEQIDNLDIPDLTDLENASRMYCDISEINNAKGTNISLVVGEDNTEKIMNVLAPNEVFSNWFNNESAYDRFGINSNIGTRINIISIQKHHDNNGVVIAITNNGKVLSRYMRNNILSNWEYDTTDLTDINNKLTELENNQIKKLFIQHQNPNEVYVKITACNSDDFSKILFTDSYGGSILITGGMVTGADYKTIKVVRLTNGDWSTYNPSTNTLNKIQNVYLGGTDIYIKCGSYTNLYIEGGFISAERVYSIPSDVTQLPILDLTQGNTTALTDLETRVTTNETKLTQLETKANLIPVVADNPTEYDLNNYEENGNYSIGDATKYSNVPIAKPALLTVIRSISYRLQIYTVVNDDDVYFRKSVDWGRTWSSWVLLNGEVDLTAINSKLTQLENTINEVGGGGIYQSGEIEVGTWTGGQKLYRRTISSRTERNPSNGTFSTSILSLSTHTECEVVKLEGVARIAPKNSTTGDYSVVILPYYEPIDSMRIYLSYTFSSGNINLACTKMTAYKLLGFDVSIYYYKK